MVSPSTTSIMVALRLRAVGVSGIEREPAVTGGGPAPRCRGASGACECSIGDVALIRRSFAAPTVTPCRPSPLRSAPVAVSRHRYFHVIGASVFVSDDRSRPSRPAHFLGMLDDEACGRSTCRTAQDPSDGAALDLYSYFGRASETEWVVAGRAVQLAEWARTHRFCGRCGTPTELQADRAGDEVPGVRAAGVSRAWRRR